VEPPQTAGVTDNPRPPPLSGEPPIGLGAGGKDPGPGGHPGGPLTIAIDVVDPVALGIAQDF
jgi:hypothetical protein